MLLFVERSFYSMNQVAAVALAPAGDALDVFRVDADSGGAGLHRLGLWLMQSFANGMRILR